MNSFPKTIRSFSILAALAVVIFLSLGVVRGVTAATNVLTNGGFESGNNPPTGWTVSGITGIDVVKDNTPTSGWDSAEGLYSVDLNGFNPGTISQTFTTVVGQKYTLSFAMASNPGYNGTVTMNMTVAGNTVGYSFNGAGRSETSMGWTQHLYDFTATSTSTTLTFASTVTNQGSCTNPPAACGPALDNVAVLPLYDLTMISGTAAAGSQDPFVEVSKDGGVTWKHAYVATGHPWNTVSATNKWATCDSNLYSGCLNQTVDYRVQFNVSAGFFRSKIDIGMMQDNFGSVFLNGTQIAPVGGGEFTGNPPPAAPYASGPINIDSLLVAGINSLVFRVRDVGGLAGVNFAATVSSNVDSPITVIDSTPTVSANNPSVTVNEGQTASNAGTFQDGDPNDNVVITASRGTVTQIGTNAGTWSWSFATTDGPDQSGPVTITATDAGGPSATTTFNLTVNNVAPTVNTTPPASGTFTVPATSTAFSTGITLSGNSVSITASGIWSCGGGIGGCPFGPNGSGNPGNGSFLAPGLSEMSLIAKVGSGPWQFVGAGPTVISGTGALIFAMNDTFWGDNVGSMSVQVVPAVVANEGPGTIGQNGTYSDVGADNVSITASVGTVTKTGTNNGTWSWTNTAPDGPADYDVIITANDGDGGVATTKFHVHVNNVAPSLAIAGSNTAYYVNWTSANVGGGTASGVITLPDASTINVSLSTSSGGFYGAQTSGGTNFWIPSAPYISPQVPNGPPDSDIIQLQGGTSTVYTVTFSQPIVDPIMAVLSLGNGGNIITYDFNAPFTIVSQGVGYWGGCSTCLRIKPGDVLEGQEGHGTIKFLGAYSTFSWTVPTPEAWHGFTFAVRSSSALASTVFVNEGQTATNSGTWSDPGFNGDGVNVTASVGSVTTNANGTWIWSFATNDGPVQSQTVTITATDKDGASTSKTFPLVVNNVAPTITAVFQVAPIPEGSVSTSGNIVAQATDPAGSNDPLTFSFDCDNNGTFETPAIPSTSSADCFFDDNGSYTVNVRVSDGDGGVATGSTIAVVTNVAPTAFLPNSPSINEGSSATFTFGNQFDPSNADTTAGFHYSFACDGNVGSLATSYAGAGTSGSVSCPFADNGSYTVVGRIFDKDNGSNTYSASVNVLNVAPHLNPVTATPAAIDENGTVTVNGSFTDPGLLDTHIVLIDWGPGQGGVATVNLAAGVLTFSASHQYLDDGASPGNGTAFDVYPINVTVTDKDGASDNANTSVAVNNVAPAITSLTVTTPINENDTATLTGAFSDPGTLDIHTVYIDWGDGSPAESMVLPQGARGFSKTHQYLDDNPTGTPSDNYIIHVKVGDDDTGADAKDVTVTVNNIAPTVSATSATINENDTASINVTVSDPGTQDTCSLTINWSEGAPVTQAVACNGTVTLTHQYLDDNPTATTSDVYSVAIKVTDDDTGVGTASANVTVNNVAPVITGATATPLVALGNPTAASGTFTDVGTQDTHTVSIAWGDATTSSASVTETGGSGSFTASHTYAIAQFYTITITLQDDDGGTAIKVIKVTVTATGKMTGGGCVNAATPAGTDKGCGKDDDHGSSSDVSGHSDKDRSKDKSSDKSDSDSKSGSDSKSSDKSGSDSKSSDKSKGAQVFTTHGFELQVNANLSIKGELEYNDHRTGDKFHSTSITSIVFVNDPAINPAHPTAKFDTAIVQGVGRLNGVDGVRFTAVITDAGEPGKNDTFTITFPDGQNPGVSGHLASGNHQAHN